MSLFRRIISLGTDSSQSRLESRRIRVINIFLVASSLVVFSFGIMNALLELPILIGIDVLLGFILIAGIVLNSYHKWFVTRFIIIYFLPLYFLIFPLFFGDIGTEYYNFVFLILGFYLLDNRKSLVFLSIYITSIFLLSKYLLHTMEYSSHYDHLKQVHYYPSVLASVIVIASAIAVFKKDTYDYQVELIDKQKNLDASIDELKEKDRFNKSLIKELNHRVKNNIQLISGLITLQTYASKNKEVVDTLQEARNRLDTIMILHQHLYQSELTVKPNMAHYINALVNYICQATDLGEDAKITVDIPPLELPINVSVHIGLICNELITNAVKYAKPSLDRPFLLRISLRKGVNDLVLEVEDNGPGFPQHMKISNNSSFGLALVKTIAEQYNGKVERKNTPGAWVQVSMIEI